MEADALAERKRFAEPLDETAVMEHLEALQGFDRAMYRYGRLLAATGGVTLKSPAKGKVVTSVDVAYTYLKRVAASNFESGKSTLQIAKATGYKRVAMSNALNDLVKRGILKSEQRGRQIKYFLATP